MKILKLKINNKNSRIESGKENFLLNSSWESIELELLGKNLHEPFSDYRVGNLITNCSRGHLRKRAKTFCKARHAKMEEGAATSGEKWRGDCRILTDGMVEE